MKRESNRPDRRFLASDQTSSADRDTIKGRVTYGGSAIHKLHPGNYGFEPPQNPRPSKSPCDLKRTVLLEEAETLLSDGIDRGMFSRPTESGLPKYIWSVDEDGEVYEAKAKSDQETVYHGYRLAEDERDMRKLILREWTRRV